MGVVDIGTVVSRAAYSHGLGTCGLEAGVYTVWSSALQIWGKLGALSIAVDHLRINRKRCVLRGRKMLDCGDRELDVGGVLQIYL